MNKLTFFFILIVIIGLGAAIYFSSANSQTAPGNTSLINPSPEITIPPKTSPTPTLVPISAEKAVIKTAKGDIEVQLYPQDAPKTVTNFATLSSNKYYDDIAFHRVIPGFMIQAGDPLSKDADPSNDGTGGYSIYGITFEDELNPDTESYKAGYLEGVLAMANRGPNTNGSQFFIMWADKADLPRNYTIFGKVTNGMEVVKTIVAGDKINSITVE